MATSGKRRISVSEGFRLMDAIEECGGNLTNVAELLGVTRPTVYRWVSAYKLEVKVRETREARRKERDRKDRSLSWRIKHEPYRASEVLIGVLRMNRGIVPCVAVACKVSPRTVYDWCHKLGLEPRAYRDRS